MPARWAPASARRRFRAPLAAVAALCFACGDAREVRDAGVAREAGVRERPNVLLLLIDDLNDWVGCLGDDRAQTPHIDRLAASGLLFTNAHCASPACNPSRIALLTGLAPWTTGFYTNGQPPLAEHLRATTLPSLFRSNGYEIAGGGKIYHGDFGFDHPEEWDERFDMQAACADRPDLWKERAFDWRALDFGDEEMPDHRLASWARDFLAREHEKPFFLTVGIFRPHLPWLVPERYFDLYPPDSLRLPVVPVDDRKDLPEAALEHIDKPRTHKQMVDSGLFAEAIRAYLASVSFSDAQVGRILDALDEGPNAKDTIVVLVSDHGHHLGEKQHWSKFTLWERSTHVPLIVRVPGLTTTATRCARPASLIDVYPTLAELCALEDPASPALDGHSLVPLLEDPDAEWAYGAITTDGRAGYAVRTERWRLIQYADGSRELYDHTWDPNEWYNLARKPVHAERIQELAAQIPPRRADSQPDRFHDMGYDPETGGWKPR